MTTTTADLTDWEPVADAPEHIPVLRSQIDALDAAIVRLITERSRLSRRVQTARMADGGVRVELGRENLVLETYRAGLGEPGIAVADAVLRAGRGLL